nr:hypothetical protein [Bacillus sp. FJAT-49736]
MQVALPRTHEAGKNLQHIQQSSQVINENAMHEMEKELIQKRQQVLKQEQKNRAMLRDKGNSDSQQEKGSGKKHQNEKNTEKQYHPFKGNHIDFSG